MSLVITIIVLLILATILFLSSHKTIAEADYSKYTSNISEVSEAFYESSTSLNGDKTAENNLKNMQQVYNYVAKDGKDESDFFAPNEVPSYTIIKDENQLGIKLPEMKVESGTGKRVPVTYATTKGGEIFTWPPYDYEQKFWITPGDTVEHKMVTTITVGKETFNIELDPEYGTLLDSPDTPVKPEEDDDEKEEEVVTPEHDFSEKKQTAEYLYKEADCVSPATYYYKCKDCDEKGSNKYYVGNALGHQYGDYVVTKEPTCAENGIKTSTCKNCGAKQTQSIEKDTTKHSGKQDIQIIKDATCITEGTIAYKCSECSKQLSTSTISALGHLWGEFEITKTATCSEKGEKTQKCSRCNEKEVQEIPIDSTKHGNEIQETTSEPTCTSKGKVTFYCSKCNKVTRTGETDALGHKYGSYVETKVATCVDKGMESKTCSRCDDTVSQFTEIDKDNHIGTEETEETKPATCTSNGEITYKCSSCNGTIRTEVIEKSSHVYGEPSFSWTEYTSAIANFKCNSCTDTQKVTATIKSETTRGVSCEINGEIKHTATAEFKGSTYTDVKNEIIDAKGHNYNTPVFNWSEDCSKVTVTRTCIHEDSTQTFDATITTSVLKESTCTEKGILQYTAKVTIEEIEYTDSKTKETETLGHEFTAKEISNLYLANEGDCTTPKTYYYKCSRCTARGTETYVHESALGHSFGEYTESEKATCISTGTKVRNCTKCGASETETAEKDLNNHVGSEIESITKQPTCTEEGTKTYKCSACNGTIITETIDKSSHVYGEPIFTWTEYTSASAKFKCDNCTDTQIKVAQIIVEVIKEVSCEEAGERRYTATVEFEENTYTDVKTEIIPAKGHTFGDPTINWSEDFTATGEFKCDCGEIHRVEAEVTVDKKDPTCEDTGENKYTANITWGDKTYTDTETEIVPPSGHTGKTEFEWKDDYSGAMAIFTCECKETIRKEAVVNSGITEDPTCTKNGIRTYTATVEFYGEVYVNKKNVIVYALGHAYGEPVFEWAEDYKSAKVTRSCQHGDSTQEKDAIITSQITKEPTCVDKGILQYTASVVFNYTEYTDFKNVEIGEVGHDSIELIREVVREENCVENGIITYTCPGCKEIIRTEEVEALGHEFTVELPVATYLYSVATCTDKAVYYHKCTRCTAKGTTTYEYGNPLGHEFISLWISDKCLASPATCSSPAIYYYSCIACDEIDTRTFEWGDPLEHTFGEPTFNWNETNTSAIAILVCEVCEHEEEKAATMTSETITYADCENEGLRKYTARVEVNGVEYTDERDSIIKPYNHSWTEIINQTDEYTGDVYCKYCRTIIEYGNGKKIQALYLEDDSLMLVNCLTQYKAGETYEDLTIQNVYTGMDELDEYMIIENIVRNVTLGAKVKKVVVKDEMSPTTIRRWFFGFKNCTEFDLAKLDVSKVESFEELFYGCENITTLDLSHWNTASATDFGWMFKNCYKLKTVGNLSNWNTSKVTSMTSMFQNCYAMTKIEGISGWSTSRVEYMTNLFYGMSNLTELDIANWSSARVTKDMFYGCRKLGKITVGSKYYFHDDGLLPTPDTAVFPGIKGGWYNLTEILDQTAYSQGYDSKYLPSGKNATYICEVYGIRYENMTDADFIDNTSYPIIYSKYSQDILLSTAIKEGSTFIGWTGNGITTPRVSMIIPAGSTGQKTFTANWNLRYTIPKGKTSSYDGMAHELLSKGGASVGTMYYKLGKSGTWQTTIPTAVNPGSYEIYYYVTAAGSYEETAVLGPVYGYINKAYGKLNTAPVALTLTYNGTQQNLVTAGTSNTGTVYYRSGDSGSWSSSIPTGRNVGKYKIYYYVEESEFYKATASMGPVIATINKADAIFTREPAPVEVKYNGKAQELVIAGYAPFGTVYYKIGKNGTWNTNIPTAIDGGEYEIYYYIEGNTNCDSSEVMGPIISRINGYAGQITPPGALELTYTGEEQILVTPATSTTGTVYYKVGGTGEWSTELPKATNVGSYRIYYYASESGDYSETSRFEYVTSVIKEDTSIEENYSVIYNQPYVLNIGSVYIDLIFREDGSAEVWLAEDEGMIIPSEFISIEGSNITIAVDTESVTAVVSEGGLQLTVPLVVDGQELELKFNLVSVEQQYIRFGQEYIGIDYSGNEVKGILNEDGSAKVYMNGSFEELPVGAIILNEYSFNMGGILCPIHPDGSRVMVDGIILSVKENVIKFGEKYSVPMGDSKMSVVMYENGSCDAYMNDTLINSMPEGSLTYTYNTIMIPPNDLLGNSDYMEAIVSRDGVQIILETEDGLINFGLILESESTPVKMDQWYVAIMEGQEQGFLVPHADGSVDIYDLNYIFMETIPHGVVYGANNTVCFMQMIATVSATGDTITIFPTMFECKLIKNDTPNFRDSSIICNQPYRAYLTGETVELIFRENGTLELWTDFYIGAVLPAECVVINGNNITITVDDEFNAIVSDNGNKITLEDGTELVLTKLVQHDIYFNKTYIYSDGNETIIATIYQDGSAELDYNGYVTEIPAGGVKINSHSISVDGMEIPIYPDGTKVIYNNIILTKSDSAIRFGELYSASLFGQKLSVRLYQDGSYEIIENGNITYYPSGSFTYTYDQIMFDYNDTEGMASWSKTFTFTSDGAKIRMDDMEQEFEMGFVLESSKTSIIFDVPYAQITDGEIVGYYIFKSDGSVEQYDEENNYMSTLTCGIVYGKNNYVSIALAAIGTVLDDGRTIRIPGVCEFILL